MKLRTARVFDKGLLLIATLLLVSWQYSLPSHSFWHHGVAGHKYVPLILLVVAAIFGALTPFEVFSRRYRTERGVTLRRVILGTFGQLLEMGGNSAATIGRKRSRSAYLAEATHS